MRVAEFQNHRRAWQDKKECASTVFSSMADERKCYNPPFLSSLLYFLDLPTSPFLRLLLLYHMAHFTLGKCTILSYLKTRSYKCALSLSLSCVSCVSDRQFLLQRRQCPLCTRVDRQHRASKLQPPLYSPGLLPNPVRSRYCLHLTADRL